MKTDFTSFWTEIEAQNPMLSFAGAVIIPVPKLKELAEIAFCAGGDDRSHRLQQLRALAAAEQESRCPIAVLAVDEHGHELLGPPHLAHDFGLVFGS